MASDMPASSAISAACNFEVMPPEPSPEADSPLALLLVLQIALFVLASLRQSVLPLMLVS